MFGDNGNDSMAIVAAAQNTALIAVDSNRKGQGCAITQSGACNLGRDPTNTTVYSATTANNLLGSIAHNQAVAGSPIGENKAEIFGINENRFF